MMQAVPILDEARYAELLDSVGGDREFAAELAATFFEEAESLLADIHSGLEFDDRVSTRRAAHTLKSTSASLALAQLSALAAQLEAESLSAELDRLREIEESIVAVYPSSEAALRAKVALE